MITKTIKLNKNSLNKNELDKVISILETGGIVLYPTDTLYGLAANIYDEMAVKKIYDIKKRSLDKALSICLSDINEIPKVAKISKNNLDIISSFLPGPYTILLEKRDCISDTLTAHSNKIGIRIPNNKISRQLSQKFPITTTSANISNCKPEIRPDLIMDQLNCDVDLILDVGLLDNHEPSTIIDFTNSPPSLVRKGIGLNNLKNKINIIE